MDRIIKKCFYDNDEHLRGRLNGDIWTYRTCFGLIGFTTAGANSKRIKELEKRIENLEKNNYVE